MLEVGVVRALRRSSLVKALCRGLASAAIRISMRLVCTPSAWGVIPGLILVYASAVVTMVEKRRR